MYHFKIAFLLDDNAHIILRSIVSRKTSRCSNLEITSGHCCDVIMGAIASLITSLTSVYSTVHSGADKKQTSKLRVTGLCAGSSPETGEFPAQMVSNAENLSISWRHHVPRSEGFQIIITSWCKILQYISIVVSDTTLTLSCARLSEVLQGPNLINAKQ